MIAKVTTFKESGKWYDDLTCEIDDAIPCFDTDKIKNAVVSQMPHILDYHFIITIDDPRPGFWFRRLFTKY